MPSSQQASASDFLQQMMKSPQQAQQQPIVNNTPTGPAEFTLTQFLTKPTGMYGRPSGV